MTTVLHVATTGSDQADGSESAPFRTINRAAQQAQPGDRVVVHEGEYREWVTPRRGGLSTTRRITYEAAAGEHVVIKGSERVTDWQAQGAGVWTAHVPNELFGSFNPFAEEVVGDWVVRPIDKGQRKHLGDVYLDGRSFYEVGSPDEVHNPTRRDEVLDDWTARTVPDPRPRPDGIRLACAGRPRHDDDLGQLPRGRPQRASRRDQRPTVRVLPHRAPRRLHHRPRVRALPGGHPVGPADSGPAGTHRTELGQGLGHRGQRHPRCQVRCRLHRQGGLDRRQQLHAPR